ncbi:MAG: pyruvate dehydrogenase (acetyl-transferring) E1 component subunit alpha [Candidatus Diapherotrites archaeon]|nr:pyruvate dehydrogenase (acetyl-transferring) E1 component subunit alpha [Candidatus Diapherotrites archaeon]
MTKKTVERFSVEMLQVLDEKGKVDKKLAPKLAEKELLEMYRWMVLCRLFDRKAFSLQRQGRIGTYAQHEGQEATGIGVAMAMKKEDFLFPSFRENHALACRGMPMENLFMYWGGDERGSIAPQGVNCFPTSIPVGTHMLHAVGFSWGEKLRKNRTVAVTFFGDGATSEGDFHEAMNFAGEFQTPTVFVCSNNSYAISIARGKQTRSKTLAQKAFAYGFEGVQVDGNDALGVYAVASRAIENARNGKGPTMIEAVTYRIGDHTTSDDASRYRPKEEVEYWKKRDPIDRFAKYLHGEKILDARAEKEILAKATIKVEEAVRKYESAKPQLPSDIFGHMFAQAPKVLKMQEEYLEKLLGEGKNAE